MSWPAENVEPLAAMTTARTLLSSWISFSAPCNSAIRPSDRLLRAAGRLRVSRRMLPTFSCSRIGSCGAAARAGWLVIEISGLRQDASYRHCRPSADGCESPHGWARLDSRSPGFSPPLLRGQRQDCALDKAFHQVEGRSPEH